MISVLIPGEPCAQGRPRATVINGRAHVYDPTKSRNWKGEAKHLMHEALGGQKPFLEGPVAVFIRAIHTCPKSDYRKRTPAPRRWRPKRPDIDQIAKAVLDAATGVLWHDDAQVVALTVEQCTAAQDEAPGVLVQVQRPWPIEGDLVELSYSNRAINRTLPAVTEGNGRIEDGA